MGARTVLVACLLALALAGCGTDDRERDAAAVVERFHAALESGQGQDACDELGEETASKLEDEERKPCEEAILSIELQKGGTVADTRVYLTSAFATLAEGGADFLDQAPEGWKVSSAGCDPTTPDQPYRCELEG